MRTFGVWLLFGALLMAWIPSLQAATIARDSFLYGGTPFLADPAQGEYWEGIISTDNAPGSQNPDVLGFVDPWQNGTGVFVAANGGLVYPNLATRGGAAEYRFGSNVDTFRYIHRALDTGYDTTLGAYYLSGLMSFNDNVYKNTTTKAYTGFVNAPEDNDPDDPGTVIPVGVHWGFMGNGMGGMDVMLRVRDNAVTPSLVDLPISTNVSSGTHLFVVKVEPEVNGVNDRVSVWLDPADLSSEAAAGTPTYQSDSYDFWVGSPDVDNTVDTVTFHGADIGSDESAVVGYDELHYGEDWEDIRTPGNPVPAPSFHILREGVEGYEHEGSEMRSGNTTYNAGDDDKMIMGYHTSQFNMRSVLSFDLSSVPAGSEITSAGLELTVHSVTGTLNTIQINRVEHPTATVEESAVNWENISEGVPWTVPGGATSDMTEELSSVDGFGAEGVDTVQHFSSTAAFVAAAQEALDSGTPLEMVVWSPDTEDGTENNFLRWWSDDASNLYVRPALVLQYGEGTGLDGDLNQDGFVGGDDLDIVRSFWGQNVPAGDLLSGDPSGDGFVGGDDLDIVRANWGQGTPPAPSSVPEPSTMGLLLTAALGLLVCRLQKRG